VNISMHTPEHLYRELMNLPNAIDDELAAHNDWQYMRKKVDFNKQQLHSLSRTTSIFSNFTRTTKAQYVCSSAANDDNNQEGESLIAPIPSFLSYQYWSNDKANVSKPVRQEMIEMKVVSSKRNPLKRVL